jgi:hypothetical protein
MLGFDQVRERQMTGISARPAAVHAKEIDDALMAEQQKA